MSSLDLAVAAMDEDERHACWAALVAMVDDVHSPQDNLSEVQWAAAERALVALDKAIDGGAR